jgi:transcriptional regulator with XRE-family HTH domain
VRTLNVDSIGDRIKRLRTNKDMKQRHLAEKLSVSDGTISNWENGRRMPAISDLKRIAELFNVKLNYFDLDDQTTYDQIDESNSIAMNQSIDCMHHGFIVSPLEQALSLSGFLFLLTAFLLPAPYHFVFLVFGVLFQIGVVTGSIMHRMSKRGLQRKTLMVQSHAILLYINKETNENIKHTTKQVRWITLIIYVFTVLGYTLLSFFFLSIGESLLTILIVSISFAQILLAYFVHANIRQTKIFNEKINYYIIKKNMSIPPLTIMLYSNVFIAIFFGDIENH